MITYIIFGIAAVVAVIMCIKIAVESDRDQKFVQQMQDKHHDIYHYNSYGKCLEIYKKHPKFPKMLTIENHTISKYTDVPERYVYTGATVGGVSTGGFTKLGGYTDAQTLRTNKCVIMLKELSEDFFTDKIVMKHREVHEIRLNGELLEAAKNASVRSYLKGDRLILVNKTDVSAGTAAMYRTGNTLGAVNALEREQSEGYPSFLECTEIMDWLKKNMK